MPVVIPDMDRTLTVAGRTARKRLGSRPDYVDTHRHEAPVQPPPIRVHAGFAEEHGVNRIGTTDEATSSAQPAVQPKGICRVENVGSSRVLALTTERAEQPAKIDLHTPTMRRKCCSSLSVGQKEWRCKSAN